ncbi:hypothetical protein BV20DRAFT_1055314 [Pilatotrama ljubarskyi]|nr:hypothetical protein BV20DRAFT_1055314 [Pilatotrama ljubarskyi]
MCTVPEHIAVRPPTPIQSGGGPETPRPSVEECGSPGLGLSPTTDRSPSRESDVSETPTVCERGDEVAPSSPCVLDIPLTAEPSPELPEAALEDIKEVPETGPGPSPSPTQSVRFLAPAPVSFFVRNRYQRRHYLSDEPDRDKEIKEIPAKHSIPARPTKIAGRWEPYNHPEGQIYFRYKSSRATFYTNAYLLDEAIFNDVNQAADLVDRELGQHDDLPKDIDVGIDTFIDEEGDKCASYYICDVEKEEVLWLTPTEIDFLVEEEQLPVLDWDHLRHAHTQWFWHHIQMFPHNRRYDESKLKELRRTISYHLFDRETSRTSNAPYNANDLHRFGQIFDSVELEGMSEPRLTWHELSHDNIVVGEFVCALDMAKIARMKALLSLEQLRHYHGTKWARLDSNRSVHRDVTLVVHNRSWWFTFGSWLLFCTPRVYIKRLDEMWLDEKINHQPWRKFIGEIQEDWTASITPSAVILTANVGFLAIQSVDQGGYAEPDRTTGQILSYISTLLSIGNIIACTILARQHRASSHLYAEDALDYLIKRAKTRWGAELLSVVLSIPAAFFIWGLLAFSAAILWLCLCATSLITRIAVVVIVLLTGFFIVLVVRNGEWTPPAIMHSFPTQMKQKLRKIPVRKLTEQSRKLSKPFRRFTGKLHRNRRPSNPIQEEPIDLNHS